MRQDTPYGPVWLIADTLPEDLAKKTVQLELMLPTKEGIVAMHTGPYPGGAWVVRAPMEALETLGMPTGSAAEHPVKEGTCWPPLR